MVAPFYPQAPNTGTLDGSTQYAAPDLEAAIVAALKAFAPFTAVFGPAVYPIEIPERVSPPAACYQVGNGESERNLSGPCGVARAQVAIVCRSHYYADCKSMALALRRLFAPRPALTPYSLYGVTVIEASVVDVRDEYIQPLEGSDLGTYQTVLTFLFRYRE